MNPFFVHTFQKTAILKFTKSMCQSYLWEVQAGTKPSKPAVWDEKQKQKRKQTNKQKNGKHSFEH